MISSHERETHDLFSDTSIKPSVPSTIKEYFLPVLLSPEDACALNGISLLTTQSTAFLLYRPALLGQSRLRLTQEKYNLDTEIITTILIEHPQDYEVIQWAEHLISPLKEHDLNNTPIESPIFSCRFAELDLPFKNSVLFDKLRLEFSNWAYRTSPIKIWENEALKLYGKIEDSQADFRRLCTKIARMNCDEELQANITLYEKKLHPYQAKLKQTKQEFEAQQTVLEKQQHEESTPQRKNFFIGKRRQTASSPARTPMNQHALSDMKKKQANITELTRQIAALLKEQEQKRQHIHEKWAEYAHQVKEIPIPIYKKDLMIEYFGMAWKPYYILSTGTNEMEIPAWRK